MGKCHGGIGNVTPNAALVEMAMAYGRSRVLCAAARLGVADALKDDVRNADSLAEACQADGDALYRLLRTLASMGITEETEPRHFRLTALGQPLRKDAPQSAWPSVVFWSDLLADSWSFLTDCVRTGRPASSAVDERKGAVGAPPYGFAAAFSAPGGTWVGRPRRRSSPPQRPSGPSACCRRSEAPPPTTLLR